MRLNKRNTIFISLSVIFIFLSFIVYFFKAKSYLDPDFGWRIRLGELILKNGIPRTDPFSYTMPSYPYVDYEWLTHVAIYKIHSLFGYGGLALVFTLLAIGTILLCVWGTNIVFVPLQILFASGILFSYFGSRAQVISWFFFAIVCRILLNENLWKRFKYGLPLIFLLWANMHGGFIIGLIVFFILAILKRKPADIIILILSALITLLNPYGLQLWREVWISISDLAIRLYIIEWRPVFFSVTAGALLFFAFSLAFILQDKRKLKIYEILPLFLLLISAFSSARNIPFFLIFSVIILQSIIKNFIIKVNSNKLNLRRFNLLYIFFLLTVTTVTLVEWYKNYSAAQTRNERNNYPRQAINYLQKNLPDCEILGSYEWGGYLDWKLPAKKVFIDGRMASWRQAANNSESSYIFGEYRDLLHLKLPVSEVFKKYNVTTVLLPNEWLVKKKGNPDSEITSNFLKELGKNNFRKIYQDKIAVILSQKNALTHCR